MKPKRNKRRSIRACQSCRKSKTKCVILDNSDRCRNCVIKNYQCVGIEEDRPTRGADKKPRKAYKPHGISPDSEDDAHERPRSSRRSKQSASNHTPASSASSSSSNQLVRHHSSDNESDEYIPQLSPSERKFKIPDTALLNKPFDITSLPEFATHQSSKTSILKTPSTDYQQYSFWPTLFSETGGSLKGLIAEIWKVFSKSDLIAVLFHLPSLYKKLNIPSKRASLEPALICALLAVSYSVQGASDRPDSGILKGKAAYYADSAHTYLITAVNASKFSLGIAQAAVCLHYYEFLPNETFSTQKLGSAIIIADIVISKLALTSIDAHQVSWVFDDDGIPVRTVDVGSDDTDIHTYVQQAGCLCDTIRESNENTQDRPGGFVLRVITRFSGNDASDEEIEKEEVRRTVWASLSQAWKQTLFHPVMPLHIADSSNYGIFLSSEKWISKLPSPHERTWSRRTVPALLERVKLLCLGAIRLRAQPLEFHARATKIILAAETIEMELSKHTCRNIIPIWQIRNIAFMIRLILTAKLQAMTKKFIGPKSYFTRKQVIAWLKGHELLYNNHLRAILKETPVIFGALSVQALRCLDIFELDRDVVGALRISGSMTDAVQSILYFHPCQSTEIEALLRKLRLINFEEECIRQSNKPQHPEPPRPPSTISLALFSSKGVGGLMGDSPGGPPMHEKNANQGVKKITLEVTEMVTSLDGGKPREMFAINGRPFNGAEPIVVDEDDVVEIDYINNAHTNTTLHAHGITQSGTIWSDGVPGVTQTYIESGENFTYQWNAEYGMYWLHDHSREQYQDGIALPVYVRPNDNRPKPFSQLTNDNNAIESLEKQDRDPQIIMLADYTTLNSTEQKRLSEEWHSELLCYDAVLINNHGRRNCPAMDKLRTYASENKNGLIDGSYITAKGCPNITESTPAVPDDIELDADVWFNCEETNTTTPKFEFEYVDDGNEQWAVLHMVSAASHWSYIVSIDEHPVYLFSQDGRYHSMPSAEPADAFEFVIGERLGVAFKLHTAGEYVMRVSVWNAPQILATHAIISYGNNNNVRYVKEEGLPALPDSKPTINYGGGLIKENATVIQSTQLRAYDAPNVPKPHEKADKTLIFTLQYDGTLYWGMSDEGAVVERYNITEKQTAETPALFDLESYIGSSSTAHYPAGSVVDVVFVVNGTVPQPPHPMHFHGLHRHLLGSGTLGLMSWNYTDVADFDAHNPDAINWKDPAYVDTFNTPSSMPDAPSYLVTRFEAGEAEPTLLHCHIGSHKAEGMEYLLIAEGKQPEIPEYYRIQAGQVDY
ncbi:hypothetical protein E3P81_03635 [Wallemia ichthyophaga]|nr:hypothetical protein E3P97_03643 [Wallemia ichthyophaga]TIB28739.1 hypothetical protein E3P85_03509 [Wallemia ichthyophaga]TIB44212.1 hypothetical protein E3P82_03640 [Wallemia ichthyophaga]TIB46583.1 hypothetical protein E3P81_03635 [Wallemia ichthyophaga]TIB49227.1 hypothetical protein E3P80_03644 [Wallemia ichthyophaga]